MAAIPSEKLRIDFGWMLNHVADYLSKVDCSKMAHAERLPKSMIDTDSEVFQVTLLHTLEARGKFGPLSPEGLIEMLKNLRKMDAVKVVDQYMSEKLYKKERAQQDKVKKETKKREKHKGAGKAVTENREEVEKMVAKAKSRTFALIQRCMRELNTCEQTAEQYWSGEVSIEAVRSSFAVLSETIEGNESRYRSPSMSSSSTSSSVSEGSTSSSSVSEGSTREEDTYAELPAHYPLPVPVQETERDAAQQERLSKPIPLPRTNIKPQPATKGEATPTHGTVLSRDVGVEECTGGTGDSGLGTGDSDRLVWIKDSQFPVTSLSDKNSGPSGGATPPPVPPRRTTSGYTLLMGRREKSPGEGYTAPFRASNMDELVAELQSKHK